MNRLFPPMMAASLPPWKAYLATVLAGVFLLAILVASTGYDESFLLTHGSWGEAFDFLMPHLTHLADGATVGGILVILRHRKQTTLMIALILALLLVLISINALKMGVFPDWDRPASVFGEAKVRLLSLGMEKKFSFPSGHSAAAGCLGWFITGTGRKNWWGIASGLLALLLAWTRVYIGVHFPGDLLAGLLLGTAIAMLSTWIVSKWSPSAPGRRFEDRFWPRAIVLALGVGLLASGITNLLMKYYL